MQIAARYLVISLAQTALGRIAQRWVTATGAATGTVAASPAAASTFVQHRAAILDALRPWSAIRVPRIRKDNGRALFQLCAALASSAATPPCELAWFARLHLRYHYAVGDDVLGLLAWMLEVLDLSFVLTIDTCTGMHCSSGRDRRGR